MASTQTRKFNSRGDKNTMGGAKVQWEVGDMGTSTQIGDTMRAWGQGISLNIWETQYKELEVVLPQNIGCNQAELDLIDANEANKNIFGKVYIKGHSGAVLLTIDSGLQTWTDINPASQQWFGVNAGDYSDGAVEEVAKKGSPAKIANGVSNNNAAEGA
ncbi:hypothetical protein BN946_scf184461.g5 [Trametes cinnabarina]|uniref:Uncharacterized protein n=1 Tax=Pycnoporus cinnabarinus TaxID=5643 RepID=A0A060SR28_PYCCI|nr:hypothetical protein BN946_scf184461.g5 [Trametes cinnabarina]